MFPRLDKEQIQQPRSLVTYFATLGPIGYIPKAPGTFGSLPGVLLGAVFGGFGLVWLQVVLLVVTAVIAWWVIDKTERTWSCHDDKKIVIDELVGQAIVTTFLPQQVIWYALGFGLFRLFDIWKPLLVGYVDREMSSSLGTLLDDVIAGILGLASGLLCVLFYSSCCS